MKFTPVESSAMSHIAYDKPTSTLHVRFSSGAEYAYHGVSADEHEALMNAPSIGGHFMKHIRAHYSGVKQ